MWGDLNACLTCLSALHGSESVKGKIIPIDILVPPESLKFLLKQRTKSYYDLSRDSNVHDGSGIKINLCHKL